MDKVKHIIIKGTLEIYFTESTADEAQQPPNGQDPPAAQTATEDMDEEYVEVLKKEKKEQWITLQYKNPISPFKGHHT